MITSRELARIQVLSPRIRQEIASIRLQTRRIPVKFASIRVKYPEFFTNAQETEYNDLMYLTQTHSIPKRLVSGINTQVLRDSRGYKFRILRKMLGYSNRIQKKTGRVLKEYFRNRSNQADQKTSDYFRILGVDPSVSG